MRLKEQLRSVILSVASNKFRVFLTSLGIIIGTFTIIMVVGIGKASEDAVTEQYKRLSVESITISRARVVMSNFGSVSASLTKDNVLLMPEVLEHVKSVGISTSTSSPVAYGSTSETVMVQGINEAYADITNLNINSGDFFTDDDGTMRNKVVVLGYNVAELLFGEEFEDAIGEKVLVKGLSFTVVGILERIGGSGGVSSGGGGGGSSSSPDDMVYIPYDVAIKYTSGSSGTRGGFSINSSSTATYIALANDIDSVEPAIEEINEYIYDLVGSDTAYTVTDAGSTLSSALETANTMSALLIAVAAIVLIVSGIGIMNVLMIAVKERTREIGILKSIGAARHVILLEFLLEAVFISILGGLIGVVMSIYVPFFLSFTSISYSASIEGMLLGLVFSVITGVFFGIYPAYKASGLNPIDALNSD